MGPLFMYFQEFACLVVVASLGLGSSALRIPGRPSNERAALGPGAFAGGLPPSGQQWLLVTFDFFTGFRLAPKPTLLLEP